MYFSDTQILSPTHTPLLSTEKKKKREKKKATTATTTTMTAIHSLEITNMYNYKPYPA
jgi:hypothetical protein